jgi:CBS domain-containing protein
MLVAETVADLAYLHQRGIAFVAEGLVGPSAVPWFSRMLGELNGVLAERSLHLARAEMAATGRRDLGLQYCVMFFGRAGRRETLTPVAPDFGIVYVDPTEGERESAADYFTMLADAVAATLRACGLEARQSAYGARPSHACRTLSEWKEFYAELIADPIGNAIYTAREYFDFHVACGDRALGSELESSILAELERNEVFLPVLANDTLAHLPPLTFFQGQVIELDGTLKHTLDVEETALDPIVDAARVFALAEREVSNSNTLHRLDVAARALPQHAPLMSDVADGLRIVAYYHGLAGLSGQGESAVIHPARLSKFEQRLLKTAFDSARRFLELTYSTYDVSVVL